MTGVFLLAWVVFPALTLLLCTGAGLLLRRAAGRAAVPGVLVVPSGLALLVVVGGLLDYFKGTAPLSGPAFVLIGVAGLALERGAIGRALARRGRGLDPWAAAAAIGAGLIIGAPILLTGAPGFTGYAHIVDTSYEFDLAAHFAHGGRHALPEGTAKSGYEVVIDKYLANGYPGGGTWTLGSISNLMPVDLSWLYQPFLAFVAAMSALSLYSLLGRVLPSRDWRGFGAFICAQPSVLVAYALGGGIKELTTACFLLLSGALLAQIVPRLAPGRAALAVPVALAATFASLTLVTVPWIGMLAVGVCVSAIALRRTRRERLLALGGSAQMAAILGVLSVPTLVVSVKLIQAVTGTGPIDLGNLSAPVPGIAATGVWISGDIRYPQFAHKGISEALGFLVIALAAVGLVYAVRRRAWSVAWLGLAATAALYYVAHRYGPWIQFKADCVSASIALLMAFAGVGAVMRYSGRQWLGAPLALVLGAGVLAGNALMYHDVTLAPYARLHDLEHIGQRFAGQGPTLTPDFEEYAEYYLRDDDQTSMVNGPTLGLRPGVNREAEPGHIFQYDLNEFSLSWVEGFRTIVMRRGPLASRPPSNYALVYLSNYYEVWQRVRPASTVLTHLAVTERPGETLREVCSQAARAMRSAGAGASIAYMPSPANYVQVDSSNSVVKGAWQIGGGYVLANGAGQESRRQPIPAAGSYDFYLGGSFGRPVSVSIDGHHVGTAAYSPSYPGQWLLIGSRDLAKAVYDVKVTRGGISLHPGNGDGVDGFNRSIGPLIITPVQPATPQVVYPSAAQFSSACVKPGAVRWVEVVRPA